MTSNWDTFDKDVQTGSLTDDEKKAINWYFIEIFMLLAFIFAYMFVIFVRFLFKVRFHITDPKKRYVPDTDFIDVEATAFQFYITMAAPVFVSMF